ncbi:signal peptide peptidase SppA [Motiliproteus coralliicola]
MSDNLWGSGPETSEQRQGKPSVDPQAQRQPVVSADSKEWRLIEKMVSSLSVEQRRSRRWGIFFKLLTFGYLFVAMYLVVGDNFSDKAISSEPHTALVDIQGAISADSEASADTIVHGLRAAFKDENTEAVILRINSPGGSPVQSGYVYDEIKRLRQLYPTTKVYAVISDIGASGAYYIAAAADEIYADKASLVGSIGVISSSFGFVEVLEKLGVERRVMTAGEHKAFLDPFAPLKATERQFWEGVLDTTHQQFIDQVKKGRGDRLKDDAKLFSGLIWTGEQSLELGLIDGLGSTGYVAREVVGVDNIVDFTPSMTPWEKLADRFGVSVARTLSTELGLKTPPLQ